MTELWHLMVTVATQLLSRHPDRGSKHLPLRVCTVGGVLGRGVARPILAQWVLVGRGPLCNWVPHRFASCSSIYLAGASGVPRGLRPQPSLSPPSQPTAPSGHSQILAQDNEGLPSWVTEEEKARTKFSF